MKISNKLQSVTNLPSSIDKTLNSKLKKERLDSLKLYKITDDSNLFFHYINYRFFTADAYKVLHFNEMKSPWNKKRACEHHNHIDQDCIRCGHISLKAEYCQKCEDFDFYNEFHNILVNNGYEEAFKFYKKRIGRQLND